VIVEYEPGVGTITQEILRRMRPVAVLVAIELNEISLSFLRDAVGASVAPEPDWTSRDRTPSSEQLARD